MCSVCIVELHVAVNIAQILSVAGKRFYGEFVAGNNKTYFHLYVNFPIFWSDFRQVWSFSTDFHIYQSIMPNFT